ncbi:recombinase family protein [Pseudogulbenkiania ferrooxidans]|uniref:Resolvase domain protein n=1 Tax=Pseudogulbenkiania ferrooxidans 2002 TaxID=279714 RepID=B9Z4V7_9NEIS|nr:Resolvase domain protein [Pseudogulbenkiania ferrooxidans 2002]
MNKKKTAIIYARVSTSRQADEGISIDSQIEQAEKKAAELGATVLRVFRDDGISGRTANRPAFQNAIQFCEGYDIDYFIVWNTSRFARNKLDAASHKKLLEGGGTKVVYVAVNIDNETDEGWFSESIFEIMDEHYSRQVSRDTRRSMLKNARDGFWNGGTVPFGYQVVSDGQRRRLQVLEHEAILVREMFDMFFAGSGCKLIAMSMNERGLLYRGRTWTKGHITNLLKNPAYAGYVAFNRRDKKTGRDKPESEWIMTKSHEPIVSEAESERVRHELKMRSPSGEGGSPHSTFVFTGILRCGECGAAMQTESANGRNKIYHYYNCSRSQKGGGCRPRRISAGQFDSWMMDTIIQRILSPERMREVIAEVRELTNNWQEDRDRRIAGVMRHIKEANKRRQNLFDILELHGKDAPNLGDLTVRLREINANIKALQDELAVIESEEMPEVDISENQVRIATETMVNILRGTTDNKKLRLLMGQFIDRIVLNSADVEMEYRPERIVGTNEKCREPVVHSTEFWLPEQGSNLRPAD